jgi:hypothetical protein
MMRRPLLGRGSGVALAAGLTFDSTLNIVMDGNSIVAGINAGQDPTRLLAQTAPISTVSLTIAQATSATALANDPYLSRTCKWRSNKGVVLYECGVSGQTWRKMNGLDSGLTTDVDGGFVAGAVNILIAWEGTNSMYYGASATQAASDAKDYIAARKLANPWSKTIIGTCLPRMDSTSDQSVVDAMNAKIDTYNAYVLANYKAMGFDAVFDVRQAGSPFNLSDYLIATFQASAAAANSIWSSETTHVHPSNYGNDYIVRQCMMPALLSL